MFWPLVALAAAGVVVLRRRRVALLPLLVPIVVVTLDAAAFYGLVRFRVPAEVSIVVLAAIGLDALATRRQGVGSRRQVLGDETEVADEVRELDLAPVNVGAQDR
jgi:hypothetical protein